jgi:hypothetical protein
MAGGVAVETQDPATLVTSRTPVGPKNVTKSKDDGEAALMDAVLIIAAAWALLFVLYFSLRQHNV